MNKNMKSTSTKVTHFIWPRWCFCRWWMWLPTISSRLVRSESLWILIYPQNCAGTSFHDKVWSEDIMLFHSDWFLTPWQYAFELVCYLAIFIPLAIWSYHRAIQTKQWKDMAPVRAATKFDCCFAILTGAGYVSVRSELPSNGNDDIRVIF